MEDPKQLVNRFVEELWNERRLEIADAIFAPDCITHQLRSGAPIEAVPRGPQAIKEHVADWIDSFPDLRFSIEQMRSEGDRVATQLLMEGTHQGAWMGIPASDKKIQVRMLTVGGQFPAPARQLMVPVLFNVSRETSARYTATRLPRFR